MKIALIGYMGSGKSSIGEKLAEVLGVPFKDMDNEIEKYTATPIPQIFSEKGEIYFRTIENKILKNLLLEPGSFVLATGGGTPCYGDNMAFMLQREDVDTVYIKTPLEKLTSRLYLSKSSRPLLSHLNTKEELNDFLRKHLFERTYYYNQSKYIIENNGDDIEEVVRELQTILK